MTESIQDGLLPMGYTKNTEAIGQMLMEGIRNSNSERFKDVKEMLNSVSEQLTLGNNSALTTTAVAAFVEKQLRPTLLGEGVIKNLPMTLRGHTGIKVPKGVNLSASSISDSTVTADDQDYGSITITPSWVGLRTSFTYELLQQGNVDVIADKLEEMGFAISKKLDSDVLSEIESASHKNNSTYDASGTNDNYVFSGASNNIDWADLASAVQKAHENDSYPDTIVVNPTNEGVLLQDSDIKDMIKFQATSGSIAPPVKTLYNMKFLVSSQVPANRTFLVDSTRCGYFVDAAPVTTWDGRIDNTIKQEVLAAKCYGVGIVRPKAITSIADNTDDPGTGTY